MSLLEPARPSNFSLSSIRNKTIVKTEKDFQGCHISLTNCRKSHIYLLSRYSKLYLTNPSFLSVNLHGMNDCIVVVGVTEKTVSIDSCENITLITVCGGLQIK